MARLEKKKKSVTKDELRAMIRASPQFLQRSGPSHLGQGQNDKKMLEAKTVGGERKEKGTREERQRRRALRKTQNLTHE